MKKPILILIVFAFYWSLNGQSGYFPLLDSNRQWNITHAMYPWGLDTETLLVLGDTAIEGIQYDVVYQSWMENPDDWQIFGFIREDSTHKVYFSIVNTQMPNGYYPEELLYDFSAQVGDTLSIYNFLWGYPNLVHTAITAIDSIEINGELRKRMFYEAEGLPNYDYWYWIEGIGSTEGLIYTGHEYIVIDYSTSLLCMRQDDSVIYMRQGATDCYMTSVGIKDIDSQQDHVLIYPNPTDDIIYLKNETSDPNYVFQVTTLTNKIVLDKRLSAFTIVVNLNHIPAGVYLYRIHSENRIYQRGKIIVF